MRTFAIVLGALIGAYAGYFVGTYVSCYWLWPGSNLCGLPAVFVACPLGLFGGGLFANRLFPAKSVAEVRPSYVGRGLGKRGKKGQLESLALVLFGLIAMLVYQFHLFDEAVFFIFVFAAMIGFILYFFRQSLN